ncbi:hypothetical protein GGS23DRAFT_6224 [Durotheca rogersii]|uniref:uncharacterized protein n=1 Tax=Durotheca rogersii TaxID=419775 RepID=UPI00221E7B1A|nr:uncharacterized protein GGS23DRAFT_6224 [Durotheca rogersii]KAI5867994.1 hypothetical protein GGS23DRAFT_6224 [Durotheca rogersii]
MAFAALPPELRSLCRRLTSTKVDQLPAILPSLLKDLSRCQGPLSKPQETKTPEGSSESAVLVHRLKTQIASLLNGRSAHGRFVAVALVKAVVETGGWECLRTSEPWVRGLLSVLQRKDSSVIKDMCIVALVKIYTLMHAYPTLVREIVTPTLPTFATACLQILKPPLSSKAVKITNDLVETIFEAFSAIIPLYPTTLRQFSAKFRAEARPYLVPTSSDTAIIPASLQTSSRRLVVRLHMTAAKGGDVTEWARSLDGLIKTFHSTADQVFRAIQENWESVSGHMSSYTPQTAVFDVEPQGGGAGSDQFPPWTGVYAGSERMIGLLDFIADYLRCRTKSAVTVPISAIVDIVTRVSSVMPPLPDKEKPESADMNSAVGREEKDELWVVFPDIQVAVMRLLLTATRRLGRNFVPAAQTSLEQLLRMFESGYRLPEVRLAAFLLLREMLELCGPAMAKLTVEGLSLIIKTCCRDILASAGHIKRPKQSTAALQDGQKSKSVVHNADAFLNGKIEDESISVSLDATHIRAAEALLTALFSHVPQQHIPSPLRIQMLRTAILCRNKDAQVASVLHPAREKDNRTPQVILPYLTQQFPYDESVEVLRFNFRPLATGPRNNLLDSEEASVEEELDTRLSNNSFSFGRPFENPVFNTQDAIPTATARPTSPATQPSETTRTPNPFLPEPSPQTITIGSEEHAATVQPPSSTNSLKRKNESADIAVSKRLEVDNTKAVTSTSTIIPVDRTDAAFDPPGARHSRADKVEADEGAKDSSDNESVHLNMELDSDDEGEDEEKEGDEEDGGDNDAASA